MRPEQKGISAFATARFHLVTSAQQSKELRALVTDHFNGQPYMPVHGERMDG
jgi:hypothetical protein